MGDHPENNQSIFGTVCGTWAHLAECPNGHTFAVIMLCGKEWCPVCGAKWSSIHRRRFARWLPKAQKLAIAGYLTITVPPSARDSLRTAEALQRFRRSVVLALKRRGFSRGLSRWHWFSERSAGTWHPHLNVILDHGFITRQELKELKEMIAKRLDVNEVVIHYQYTKSVRRMVHWLKYITRATFTDLDWDGAMADELYRFHNTHAWGQWDGLEVQWNLPKTKDLRGIESKLVKLGSRICPICGASLEWLPESVSKITDLKQIGFVDYVTQWLYCSPSESDL